MPSKSVLRIALLGSLLLAATTSYAQQPAPTPPPNPLDNVPDKMPFDVPYGAPIGLDRAQAAIAATVAEAKKRDWKLIVTVVDSGGNLVAFLRYGSDGSALLCVANFAGMPHRDYRFGLPFAGTWREVVNTDAEGYGGSGVGNLGGVVATPIIAALSASYSWTAVFATGAVCALVAAGLWLKVR